MMDIDQAAKAMRDEEMLAETEDFIEGFNQPTYRGMRVGGCGVRYLVIPARVEWALTPSSPLLSGEAWLEFLLGDEPMIDLHHCVTQGKVVVGIKRWHCEHSKPARWVHNLDPILVVISEIAASFNPRVEYLVDQCTGIQCGGIGDPLLA